MSKVTTTFAADDQGMVATIKKIDSETKGMKKTTEDAEKGINLSFMSMAKAGAALAIGVGVVKGAFAALQNTVANFGQALDLGGRLSDLSARTGETAGNLMLLERAFDNSGAGADKVGATINKLQKFMGDAKLGTEKNIEALKRLGLSYEMLSTLSPTEQLEQIAIKISDINSPTERAAAAMQIFGRSGGELLPLLSSFAEELNEAKMELGSMTNIMDRRSEVFDKVSDKIQVIKGKFMEFAAGVLDKVIPALELFAVVLSRIDAAKIGQTIADAFIGGQKAMQGFSAALGAINIGEFGEAWKITFLSIKLQFMQTANQIYKIAISTGHAIFSLISNMLSAGPLLFLIDTALTIIGLKIKKHVVGALMELPWAVQKVLGISQQELEKTLLVTKTSIETQSRFAASYMRDIPGQFVKEIINATDVFKEKFKSLEDPINTAGTVAELAARKAKIEMKLLQEQAMKGFGDFKKALKDIYGDGETKREGSLFGGMMDKFGQFKDKLVGVQKSIVTTTDKIVENTEKLNAAAQKAADLRAKMTEKREGKGFEEEAQKAEKLIGEGKFAAAGRAIRKIEEKAKEDELRGEGVDRDRRSVADIAKEEGINTFGKSRKQLREAIIEKRKEEAKKKEEEAKKAAEPGKGKEGKPAEQPAPKKDPILDMVEKIKEILEKIEPKLPTHALAL